MYISYVQEGLTALILAAKSGHVDMLKELLKHTKINVNLKDKVSCFKFLISLGNSMLNLVVYFRDMNNFVLFFTLSPDK